MERDTDNFDLHQINNDSKIVIDNQLTISKTGQVEEEEEAMIINDDLDISINSQEDDGAPLKKRLKFMEEEGAVNSENIIIVTNTSQHQTELNKVPSNEQILILRLNDNDPTSLQQQETLSEPKEIKESELRKRISQVQSQSDKNNDNNEMDMKRSRVSPTHPHRAIEIPISGSKIEQPEKVIPLAATDDGEQILEVKDELEECVEEEDQEEVYDEAAGDSNDECDYRNDYPDNDFDDEFDDGYRYDDYGEGPTYHNGEDEPYAYADGEEMDPLKKFSALKLLDGDSSPSEKFGGDDDSDYDDVYGNEVDESYDYGYNV